MPIYAFACQACGHAFDNLQRMSDPDPAECPECGAAQIKRQLTAPSFRLAGAGWYETDFKKDSDRKRNIAGDGGEAKAAVAGESTKETSTKPDGAGKSDSGPAKDSSSAGESKVDSKPASKSESKPAATPSVAPPPKSD